VRSTPTQLRRGVGQQCVADVGRGAQAQRVAAVISPDVLLSVAPYERLPDETGNREKPTDGALRHTRVESRCFREQLHLMLTQLAQTFRRESLALRRIRNTAARSIMARKVVCRPREPGGTGSVLETPTGRLRQIFELAEPARKTPAVTSCPQETAETHSPAELTVLIAPPTTYAPSNPSFFNENGMTLSA